MILGVKRVWLSEAATIGMLDIDGVFECYTLERPAVQIPDGSYPVVIAYSPHFQRDMPLLQDVPGRTAIEIHWGDFPENSEGCILIGKTRVNQAEIEQSIAAFAAFFPKLEKGLSAGPVTLTVETDTTGAASWPGA